jgi:hypothetical protein
VKQYTRDLTGSALRPSGKILEGLSYIKKHNFKLPDLEQTFFIKISIASLLFSD